MNNHRSTDLLTLVADNTHERDQVRRICSEHLAPDNGYRISACCGPCEKGRRPCPTPDECQLTQAISAPRLPLRGGDFWRVLALALASWAIVESVLLLVKALL